MSSGTASAGCVSFSWMANLSANSWMRRPLEEQADAVLERAGDEEELLLEPELLAGQPLVVRVEDLADVLAPDLGLDGAPVLAVLEGPEVELLRGDGAPEAQEVGVRRRVAEHGGVVRHALDDALGDPPDVNAPRRRPVPRSTCPPKPTGCSISQRRISHGLPVRSHRSVISTCQPSRMVWSKMPNS